MSNRSCTIDYHPYGWIHEVSDLTEKSDFDDSTDYRSRFRQSAIVFVSGSVLEIAPLGAKDTANLLPRAVPSPSDKIAIHGLPGGEPLGQLPPGKVSMGDIENGVDHRSH